MKHANIRKIVIGLVSALVVTFSATAASACKIETEHPQVEITYEFDSKTYAVKYTLYRNMYPNTVRHFIELTENKFFDNTIIHNYSSNDWFTGGYEYNETSYSTLSGNASQMSEYFEQYSKEDAYVKLFNDGLLTPSVYSNYSYVNKGDDRVQVVKEEDALPYVMGEFNNNIKQEIENGALTAEYGSLKMFYYQKTSTQKVYVTPVHDQRIFTADYKKNCATSVFAIQTGSSSSYSANDYTVFGVLESDDVFEDLLDAISDYKSDNYGSTTSSSFTLSTTARVDNLDNFSNKAEADKGKSETFNVPLQPIIIQNVRVTKY